MRRQFAVLLITTCLIGRASVASAQQRPLVTEDPETVGAGLILFEGGMEIQREIFYPVSGLEGDLLRFPTLGVSFGLSSIAELQLDGGFYQRLIVNRREQAPLSDELDFEGDRTSDVDDLILATKIRLVPEAARRPAFGLRFATRLPNASNESGLGLDTTDFFVTTLIGKTIESVRMVGNIGLGILGDPTEGDRQGDVLTYGFSIARAVREGVEIVGEINGRYAPTDPEDTPPGTDSRAAMRLGARFTRSTIRVDAGIILGMTSRDPSFGFSTGLTWVFRGFTVP